jgi:bifunctional NMN adenylyltransferase/nudix hydrolase
VQRKAAPGEGLYALPGGFLNQKERIIDGMIRELTEETRIKVPDKVLIGSIKNQHVFDHPNRSQRGRTITHAFHIELPPGPLPKVKGSDDAKSAAWWRISDINARWDELFEDHGDIISYFVGV